jgi:hypothetical protein
METTILLEELVKDIYPFKPKIIVWENRIYLLSEKLECSVEYKEDNYIIRNDEFDITVWGETREEAEDAFAFAFDALFNNFANEKDDNLTVQSQILKKKLNNIVLKIVKANEN